MGLNLYEAKTNFSKLVQFLIEGKEDSIVVKKNGKPVVQLTPITSKNSKRIGAAKKEMKDYDISLEEFNSIEVMECGI